MARILALDDNPTILEILIELLDMEGYDVMSASSFHEAMKLLETGPVDLIITDYTATRGPTIEGNGLRRLAEATPGAAIVVLTGYGNRDELEVIADSVDDVIAKPFNIADLVDRLRDALKRREQRQART
jgi:DNA-binding response OmpR family regulator